jgi:branched-chain amino acid transport system ATP-binding protein
MTSDAILSVKEVSKFFGGLAALSQVSFDANEGEITALIGPNGSGKTTALNVITGVYPADRGEIAFCGKKIQTLRPFQIAGKGVSRTFQNLQVFRNMTVLENVKVGLHTRTRSGFLAAMLRLPLVGREERLIEEKAQETLAFLDMGDQAQWPSHALPYGDQKRIEIARALVSEPRLLLLDEPAAGLNATETQALGQMILRLKQRGISLLLVEHDMNLVMGISDRVIVIHYGAKIAEGTVKAVQSDPRVIGAYLGRELHDA